MAEKDPLVLLLEEWLGGIMRRSMHSMIHYMKAKDLSMSQIGALFQINRGRSNVSDLGEGLGITMAATSQMLERLVQQKLVRRSEDPDDRRVRTLVLTEKGIQVMRESLQARQGWVEDLVGTLSPSEREQVASVVKIMADRTTGLELAGTPQR